MKKYLKLLKSSKLFAEASEHEIEEMLKCLSAEKRSYKKGEYIFRIGDKISEVAMVLEGCVHIQKDDYWGNLSIVSVIREGEIFGEVFACLENERMVNNAVTVRDSVVLFLNIERILKICSSACVFHTRLIKNLLLVIAQKNRALMHKVEHMSKRTTREKLLSYLFEQSLKTVSADFEIPFNRQQLADFLSVDRSAMSNELCKMRDEGMIKFNKNNFELINRDIDVFE